MGNLPRYEYDLVRKGTLSDESLEQAMRAANDYSVSLVRGDKLIGSGTLVSIEGGHGILTADHVWQALSRDPLLNHFAIVLGSVAHRFECRFDECTPFVVGAYSEDHEEQGPDLAFIRLDNLLKVGDIKGRKSFYRLTAELGEMFRQIPRDQCPWIVWGAPAEKASTVPTPGGEPVSKVIHFAGTSEFTEIVERAGFDYVKVKIASGDGNFPSDFGGVSGGGVWIPFWYSEDPEGTVLKPMVSLLLAGVAYYQTGEESGWKTLILHGPRSIYERVIQFASQQLPMTKA